LIGCVYRLINWVWRLRNNGHVYNMHSLSKIDEEFNNAKNMTKIGKAPKNKNRWIS
jgi:hypothetical protein